MEKFSDEELLEGLRKRFEAKEKAFHDLMVLTKKLEQVNKKLQESESLKSNFLSNIRNEINNPLASIMGLSKHMFSVCEDAGAVASVAGMIYAESYDLDVQLKNIFTAAEIEAGESILSLSSTDIAKVIENAADSLKHTAKEKNLTINILYENTDASEARHFKTDPEKLNIAILNLLANAIKFSNDGGEVNIRVSFKDNLLIVSVEDFGKGIKDEDRQFIFDRFKQLESGIRKSHRGHGLGLSVTKSLVELLSGNIAFMCKPDKGCVFTMSIPEAEGAEGDTQYSEDSNEFIFKEEGETEQF